MDWEEFLRLMSGPSVIPLVVGWVLSVLSEYVPAFARLVPKWKRAVFFLACVAVPLLAAALGCATLAWPVGWAETFWPALVAGVMAFGSGTLSHLPKLPDAPSRVGE